MEREARGGGRRLSGYFDMIPHAELLCLIKGRVSDGSILKLIKGWLRAPMVEEDPEKCGRRIVQYRCETPQGGVISPLLANLFLHYSLDKWLERTYPNNPFERYADDGVVHCRSRAGEEELRRRISERLAECGLEVSEQKTKVVYSKVDDRTGSHEHEKFIFFGCEFRPRLAKNRWGRDFLSFLPAVSGKAIKAIWQQIKVWKIPLRSDKTLEELSRMFTATIRGWGEYYGRYYRSLLHNVFEPMERQWVKWRAANLSGCDDIDGEQRNGCGGSPRQRSNIDGKSSFTP